MGALQAQRPDPRGHARTSTSYELGIAVQKIYDFIWDTYCDWYIELTKARLYGEDEAAKAHGASRCCSMCSTSCCKLLHPFMPFITEEIWQAMPHEGAVPDGGRVAGVRPGARLSRQEETEMEMVMDAIRAVRNRRAEMNVPQSRKSTLYVVTAQPEAFLAGTAQICKPGLCRSGDCHERAARGQRLHGGGRHRGSAPVHAHGAAGGHGKGAGTRLEKEIANAEKNLACIEKKLSNEGFLAKAPESVVAGEKEKAAKLRNLLEQLTQSLARMQK